MNDEERVTEETDRPELPLECPYGDCEWTSEMLKEGPDPTFEEYDTQRVHEERSLRHYEQEHAGRVRVRVTLEMEQQLADRDPHDVADKHHDQFAERDDLYGWGVAYAVAEVVEESDPHPPGEVEQ